MAQVFIQPGLTPLTHYYLAIRSRDEMGNLSGISNSVEFDTAQTPIGWSGGFAGQGIAGAVISFHSELDTLYVGGNFSGAGGIGTRGVMAWDGTSWSALGVGLSGGTYGTQIFDLEFYNGMLHAAGSFTSAGGQSASNVVRWTGSGWEGLPTGGSSLPAVALCVFNGDLLVGGPFNQGIGAPFSFLSRYDGTSFHSMGWNFNDTSLINQIIDVNGQMVIVGAFERVPGSSAQSFAMSDGTTYTVPDVDLVGAYSPPYLSAVCEFGGDIIVGGNFNSSSEGETLNHIARWDGVNWYPMDGGMTGGGYANVDALVVYRGLLVAGGVFNRAGGVPANNIAFWDGVGWLPMGNGLESAAANQTAVRTLATHDGGLFVGGVFETAGGTPSPNIARWDLD